MTLSVVAILLYIARCFKSSEITYYACLIVTISNSQISIVL